MKNFQFYIITFISIIGQVHLATKTNYQNILTEIFTTNAYNKKVLPNEHFTGAITIDVSLHFLGINEIDEIDEKFVTTGFLTILWIDEGLKWTPASHGGISNIYVPQEDIWKPDVVLQNGFKRFIELGGDFYYLYIESDGEVSWFPFEVFESRCSLDTSNFPFDKQSCDIIFVIWTHSSDHVSIEKSKQGFSYANDFQENSVWKIESVTYSVSVVSRESKITFTFNLKRKPLFYVINILLPVIFLGLLNGVVFILPSESGEKTGYSVTVFLSLAVFLTIISSLLPTNSDNISILGVYLLLQVIFGVIVLFLTTLQIRLSHRSSDIPVTGCYKKITRFSRKIRCYSKCKPNVTEVKVLKDEKEAVKHVDDGEEDDALNWGDVASGMDFIFFWSFLSLYILLTCIVFGYMLASHNS